MIERELGRGGMGEVFLARDTRLDRRVAIKAMPVHLSQDADRLARFQREAKVLASLNHPGIGAIYGLEQANGQHYLILEYIEGETLADRLASGAIAAEEAVAIAKQMAEALEIAHEKGVIHRDLKPANVMVTPDGVVKVLDFGLARTAEGSPSSTNAAGAHDSPTLPVHSPTIPGAIMGTAGYMSPEQARGKPVDKRSDIFSFGCVLYEMLTGACPFPGETVTDSLGAILHREPDWALIPAATPGRVRELLRTCLVKDRRNRLHDIADARLELERAIAGHEWTHAGVSPKPRGTGWRVPAAVVAAGALLAAGVALPRLVSPSPQITPGQTYHVATMVEQKPAFGNLAAISPDARFLVYTAWPDLPPDSVKPSGVLVIKRLDRDETELIEGTEGAREAALSPNGRAIAFAAAKDTAGTKLLLKTIALDNGRPVGKPETVCELPSVAWPGLCWASDREIVFSPNFETVIYSVSASGGEPREVLREDLPKGIETWGDFRPLQLGKSILATRWSFVGQKIRVNTEAIDLATGKRTLVLADAGSAQYIPDATGGYLVATRSAQTSLIAARFDLASLRTIGEPVTVWSGNPMNAFRLAHSNGTLAIVTRPAEVLDRRLAWLDDKGQPQPVPGMMRSYGQIGVSPDGTRVLASMDSAGTAELISECWVQDLARRTSLRIPLRGSMIAMAWSADSRSIAYGLAKDGGFSIEQRPSDGSGDGVTMYSSPDSRTLLAPSTWSPDGKTLAFVQVDLSTDNADVYLLRQDAASTRWNAVPYTKSPVSEELLRFSPDGKWAIISSSQSGRNELYVQQFTGDGEADARAGRKQISIGGASRQLAWWGGEGKQIRYMDPDGRVIGVDVKTDPAFTAGEAKELFSTKDLKFRASTFGPDGRLLVVLQGESEQTTQSVGVIVNFADEVRAKLPKAK